MNLQRKIFFPTQSLNLTNLLARILKKKKQLHRCQCLSRSTAQPQVKAIFLEKPLEYLGSDSNCSLGKEHYLSSYVTSSQVKQGQMRVKARHQNIYCEHNSSKTGIQDQLYTLSHNTHDIKLIKQKTNSHMYLENISLNYVLLTKSKRDELPSRLRQDESELLINIVVILNRISSGFSFSSVCSFMKSIVQNPKIRYI